MRPSTLVESRESPGRGRGVFARTAIAAGQVIESCPVLVVPKSAITEDNPLCRYTFEWSSKNVAIALGFGSLYNHSYTPNARYAASSDGSRLTFRALRDIREGEEILVNYGGSPESKYRVGFEVE